MINFFHILAFIEIFLFCFVINIFTIILTNILHPCHIQLLMSIFFNHTYPILLNGSVSWYPQKYEAAQLFSISIMNEYDTEDWNNDATNSTLPHRNKLHSS